MSALATGTERLVMLLKYIKKGRKIQHISLRTNDYFHSNKCNRFPQTSLQENIGNPCF